MQAQEHLGRMILLGRIHNFHPVFSETMMECSIINVLIQCEKKQLICFKSFTGHKIKDLKSFWACQWGGITTEEKAKIQPKLLNIVSTNSSSQSRVQQHHRIEDHGASKVLQGCNEFCIQYPIQLFSIKSENGSLISSYHGYSNTESTMIMIISSDTRV